MVTAPLRRPAGDGVRPSGGQRRPTRDRDGLAHLEPARPRSHCREGLPQPHHAHGTAASKRTLGPVSPPAARRQRLQVDRSPSHPGGGCHTPTTHPRAPAASPRAPAQQGGVAQQWSELPSGVERPPVGGVSCWSASRNSTEPPRPGPIVAQAGCLARRVSTPVRPRRALWKPYGPRVSGRLPRRPQGRRGLDCHLRCLWPSQM